MTHIIRKVAVVEGDGIGHEVIPVALEVLKVFCPGMEFIPVEAGYDRFERTGEAIGKGDIGLLKESDAVLFGAVTTPPSPEYRSVVVRIRKELDLFANIRPVIGPGFDITIVRENLEGLYSGIEEIGPDRATTLRVLTKIECERIARFACGLAGNRCLTIGHKANVLKSDVFFRDICVRTANLEGVAWKERFIDALCLDVLQHPSRYDIIVTTNMFGDILSDVAAYLAGGLGMLPSANIGEHQALFEPVHGSAPDIAGKGIANPAAAIRSVAMLLTYAGDQEAADRVEEAVRRTINRGIKTPDLGGNATTAGFGEAVLTEIETGLAWKRRK
ncbi:MAG TPA: isocitrate/isopropylmalate family dehydrogenase [Methanoregulaceae archaeon]|nr:isocitrate/isopropylmalate family dehydrogenase [Methanoregulaceae archaeon]